jgi:hypothetical protein
MIWYDISYMIWYDVMWYGMIYMIWYDIYDIWYMVWYDIWWYDMMLYGIYDMIYDIWYDIFNCNWVDPRWQQYSTHLHTNSTQNTENETYITIKRKKKFGKCWPCPVFASYTLTFALQLRKKHEKTSVMVAARTSQADTVQYKNNEQYNTQKKTVTQSNTVSQNNKEHNTQQRKQSISGK